MALNSELVSSPKNLLSKYQENEILTSSPEKLVLFLYGQAILGCKQKVEQKTSYALAILIDSLNFDYNEMATGLFRLYDYTLKMVKQNKFDQALPILTELRQTWQEAVRKKLKAA